MTPHHLSSSRQYYLFVVLLGALTAFGPLSIDMYLPALPAIADNFGVAVARVELSLASFFIGMTLGQVIYGPLSDRFGRKMPLYAGLGIYIVASAACAVADTDGQLIALRFVQAIGGCAGMVLSRAMVRDLFDHRESARVFSLLFLVMGLAPILAPMAGGYMLTFTTWRMIFWFLSAMAVACLVVVIFFLPDTHQPDRNVRLSRVFHTYWDIFKGHNFRTYAIASGFAAAGMFAYITGSAGVFITHFGFTPQEYAWLFGANAMGLIALSQVNGYMMSRTQIKPETVLDVATAVHAVAGVAMLAAGIAGMSAPWLVTLLFLYLAPLGAIYPNMGAGALQHEKKRAGAASALSGVITFGLATVTSGAISFLHVGGAIAMSVVAGLCGAISCAIYYAGRRHIARYNQDMGYVP
jgi:DHA1 family bicyclomycin/chloramphenicol resistance-like MFS transporter